MSEDPGVDAPVTPEDPDVREEVRAVQEGDKDAGLSNGVATEELAEATVAEGQRKP